MLDIFQNKKWLVEEDLLTLPVLDIVLHEVFVDISSIPLKIREAGKVPIRRSISYISGIYISNVFAERLSGKVDLGHALQF